MNARVYDVMICMIRCMLGFVIMTSMIGVYLGMFDAILIVRCMLACVCVSWICL